MRDAVPNNKPMEDEKLDHRTSESMPICHHDSMTIPGTSNLFRRKNFCLLLFWDALSEDF